MVSQEHEKAQDVKPKRMSRLGPFLLLKTLGVGEFSKVAVKLVKKESIDSSLQLEKIRQEIEILKTLDHPYIVKLLSVNETSACIGLVLEYAEGGELFEYIYKQKYLQEDEASLLFSQLISCVHYMHQKSIVHRDLKLENLLLDCRGNLLVTDFGFANTFSSQAGDLMSTSCGSPCYAAPELVMTGSTYSARATDVWSSGVILYAMLCGYLPFDDDIKNPNDNIGLLYRYIMENTPKYPSRLSKNAKDLIGGMLVPDPTHRWTVEMIMAHPWLHEYQDLFNKPVVELEAEAQYLKQILLDGTTSDIDRSECYLSCTNSIDSIPSLLYHSTRDLSEPHRSQVAILQTVPNDPEQVEPKEIGAHSAPEKIEEKNNPSITSFKTRFISRVRPAKKTRKDNKIQNTPSKSTGLISWIKNRTQKSKN